MVEKPKILIVEEPENEQSAPLAGIVDPSAQAVVVRTAQEALDELERANFQAVVVGAANDHCHRFAQLLQTDQVLSGFPEGAALLDAQRRVVWSNPRFRGWCRDGDIVGLGFYEAMSNPDILGPDFCPFHTALSTGQPSSSKLRTDENQYFKVHAAPLVSLQRDRDFLIVSISDITTEVLQQQKLEAIHKAGTDLADLMPDEIFNMAVEDRIELLKSNILHFTKDLLNFNVVEIRLLDQSTRHLSPLLAVGIDKEAADRALYARPQHNGVTGFVAATGKSYLCEDTVEDPLYIESFQGARSSLTVPLTWHDEVIGTFNVESPTRGAFSESDLQFLEIFCRDVARALNTLELLVAQRVNTAQESVEAIHSAIAVPMDEILNDAVNVMERYIGHEPEVVERLQSILRNARDIKRVIQNVGENMAPAEAVPASMQAAKRPKLFHQRVLVVDADDSVRNEAHALLERYGCIVETAHTGTEAASMVRTCDPLHKYNAIISDIRLPDFSGYQLYLRLMDILDEVPLILMTGFGYDPGHSLVNARRAGLPANAVLYKPFRLDQLLETVEATLDRFCTEESDAEPESS